MHTRVVEVKHRTGVFDHSYEEAIRSKSRHESATCLPVGLMLCLHSWRTGTDSMENSMISTFLR